MHERIDRAIDRLDDALRAEGFAALEAPASREALGQIAEEVAPYRLPPDLERLWERVDFQSLAVVGYRMPALLDPAGALVTHRMNIEEFPRLYGPPLLFPIARHSGTSGRSSSRANGATAAWCSPTRRATASSIRRSSISSRCTRSCSRKARSTGPITPRSCSSPSRRSRRSASQPPGRIRSTATRGSSPTTPSTGPRTGSPQRASISRRGRRSARRTRSPSSCRRRSAARSPVASSSRSSGSAARPTASSPSSTTA